MTLSPLYPLRAFCVAIATLGMLGVALHRSGLHWQHTESLARGIYRTDRGASPTRGSIVRWCLDSARGRWARERGYLTRGSCPGAVEPLGKVVLAVGGDTVEWTEVGARFRGRLVPGTRAVLHDHAGRRIDPVPWGRYVLPPGSLWLYSPYSPRSLDSRFVGPVPTEWVLGVERPLWTAHQRWAPAR
jgi:conjugative transfer signal peptidase TraF